jgi:hypothetical protein
MNQPFFAVVFIQVYFYLCENIFMEKKQGVPVVHLNPESPLAKDLIRMLEHKKLRALFYAGEISMNELNRMLKEKGINKKYEHPRAV